MTHEEKAKAYDEAIERAKQFLDFYKDNVTEKQKFLDIFPELTESEDERIRKFLIGILSSGIWKPEWPFSPVDCVAYLEKQRKLFESGSGLYYYDGEKTTYLGYPSTEDNPYDFAMSQQEKQKEPGINWMKSDNVKNPDKPYIDKAGMFYTTDGRMCYTYEIEKQKEQKPIEPAEDIFKEMEDAKKEAEKPYFFQYPYYEPPCFHGGICTNPYKDCINCPRTGGDIGIYTTSGTYKKD